MGEVGWPSQVAKGAAANTRPQAEAGLITVLTSTRGIVAFWSFSGILFLIILDMVFKPFS